MTDSRATGLVREWHEDEGWGVLDSADTPGGCWCHFSSVSTGGYASLDPGTPVEFAFERDDQDGYAYRATDARPKGHRVEHAAPITGPSIGYLSRRTIVWNGPEDDQETAATYEVIAAAYAHRQATGQQNAGWLQSHLDHLATTVRPAGVVLDLGCGPGLHVAHLRALGFQALGLDLSRAMLAQAASRTTSLVRGRIEQLPLRTASVDAVWSSFALLHIPRNRLPAVFAEIARVLAPGGQASLTFAGGDELYREQVPYRDGQFRTFYPLGAQQVAALGRSSGFEVVAQSADPDSYRAAHHALLRVLTR